MLSLPAFLRAGSRRAGAAVLLAAALLAAAPARAQAPTWAWAEAINQSPVSAGVVTATATDAAGNVYLAGSFADEAVFGSTTLTSAGSLDAFVAKYDPVGRRYLWAVRAGGASGDEATALAVRGNSVYVAGNFGSATAGFGNLTLTNASTGGGTDAFVAKLATTGASPTFAWARGLGGSGDDVATALTQNTTTLFVAGSFQNTASFGALSLTAIGTSRDAFAVSVLDMGLSGFLGWAVRAGGAEDDAATALAMVGNALGLAGHFGGTGATFGTLALTNAGGPGTVDAFVTTLDLTGTTPRFAWAQRMGGLRDDLAYALAAQGTAVYVGGSFASTTATFGPATLTNTDAGNATPNPDGFVARLTDGGAGAAFAWATAAGGLGTDEIQALMVRGSVVYAGGYFDGATANFGPHLLTAAGTFRNEEIAVARLQDNGGFGAWTWAQRAGGVGDDRAQSLNTVGTQVLVGGYITPPGSFGLTTFAGPTGTLAGTLASLTDPVLDTAMPVAMGGLACFPSPAHGSVAVRLPAGAGAARAFALLDALGRPVRQLVVPVGAMEATLDVRGLAPGLYVLCGEGLRGRVVVE